MCLLAICMEQSLKNRTEKRKMVWFYLFFFSVCLEDLRGIYSTVKTYDALYKNFFEEVCVISLF